MGIILGHIQSQKSGMVEFVRSLKTLLRACLFLCCSFFVIIKSASLTYAAEIEKPLQVKNTVAAEKQETIQSLGNILVLGDSISAAFGLKKSEGWVALLQREIGEKYQLVNASISGDTTTGGRFRLAKALETYQPKFVLIELGGNDGLRGTPIKQIRANLEAMVKMAKEAGAQPMLLGMMIPPNYGERYTSAFASIYSDLASEKNIPLVPFLLDGVAGVEGMMQDDGIHPTEAAQAQMMEHVKKSAYTTVVDIVMDLSFRTINSIEELGEDAWNALAGEVYPFTRYQYLNALEKTGAVGGHSGWSPHHVLAYQGEELVAALPSYIKEHSYGEYVFDHAWANAYHQYGLSYYPKLITAIPFTPISGPRILLREGFDQRELQVGLADFIPKHCQELGLSTWHILFPEKELSCSLRDDFLQRQAVHFQWSNEGFQSFDDFLATFSSRKRKNLKKERASIAQQAINVETWEGKDISPELWRCFYNFYQITYAKRSGHGGYLPAAFFDQIAKEMPEYLVLMMAKREGEYIAGALNFKGVDALYGRYWGCIEEANNLHFELCYYQGIDYCIQKGLKRFDPGVQGEHKIQRGFCPTYTYSNHYLLEEGFRQPVADFIEKENEMLAAYYEDAHSYLPFRKSE